MDGFPLFIAILISLLHLYVLFYSLVNFGFVKNLSNDKYDKNLEFIIVFTVFGNFVLSFIFAIYFYSSNRYFVRGNTKYSNTVMVIIGIYFLICMGNLFTHTINPVYYINVLCIWTMYFIFNFLNIMITIIIFRIKEYLLRNDFRTIYPHLLTIAYFNEIIQYSDNMTEPCSEPGDINEISNEELALSNSV